MTGGGFETRGRRMYHFWSADFDDVAIACTHCGFPAGHARAVAEHDDANEGVGVGVPAYDGLVVLPWGFDVVVLIGGLSGSLGTRSFFFGLLAGFDGDVDVPDFIVHLRDQIDAGDLGDDGEGGWVVEGGVHERSASSLSLAWRIGDDSGLRSDGLWCVAPNLTSGDIAFDPVSRHDLWIQHLIAEFLDGLWGE